jgi:hypothetical protein
MVECFWPGATAGEVADATGRLDEASAALAAEGVEVRRTVTTFVPEEETVLWLFDAAAEPALHTLARRAGVRFDRVLTVVSSSPKPQSARNGRP